MSNLFLKKVKVLSKQNKIKFDFVLNGDDLSGTYSEPAAPEFYKSLEMLDKTACQILEVPEEMADRIIPYGATFSFVDDGCTTKASIQCKLEMLQSDTEANVSTPMRTVSVEYEDGLEPDACRAINEFYNAAVAYLKGHRAQTHLFEDAEKDVTPRPVQIAG